MKWLIAFFLLTFCPVAFGQEIIEQRVLTQALSALKTPYQWGGTNLAKGVDCSGFTSEVFKRVGANLPRTVSEQVRAGKQVSMRDIHVGDLVFFKDKPDGKITHVGIYAGYGKMVHAPRKGTTVRIDIIYGKIYGPRFAQARRIVESPPIY
ncbi:MAG: C40 family peptidase [Azoarcus sp.]|nr:C40 family peptidase [Azoarcus sp.]